jgi:hypothetical protein
MADLKDIISNIEQIYGSNNSLNLLKDFERVIDELDIYVFDNWIDGELVQGPNEERYHISCTLFWPIDKMPDPKGAARLLDYGCKIKVKETILNKVRKIKNPDDIRPGTKKGKIDQEEILLMKIVMPKKLITDIQRGYDNLDRNKIEDILTQNHASTIQVDAAEQQSQETTNEQPAQTQ